MADDSQELITRALSLVSKEPGRDYCFEVKHVIPELCERIEALEKQVADLHHSEDIDTSHLDSLFEALLAKAMPPLPAVTFTTEEIAAIFKDDDPCITYEMLILDEIRRHADAGGCTTDDLLTAVRRYGATQNDVRDILSRLWDEGEVILTANRKLIIG